MLRLCCHVNRGMMLYGLYFVLLVSFIDIVSSNDCAHLPESECPERSVVCRCRRFDMNRVICCHVMSDFELKEGLACASATQPGTKAVHVRNASLDRLDAGSQFWQSLVSLAITDSHVSSIFGHFTGSLTCLNLSSNGLVEADPQAFKHLTELTLLDLSHNKLKHLPEINVKQPHFWLDISGNSELWCQSLTNLMGLVRDKEKQLHFYNENSTSCLSSTNFHWFNTTESIPLKEVEGLIKLQQQCPGGDGYECKCQSYRLDMVPGKPLTLSVMVDCSNSQLIALPPILPPNTIFLNVTNNNITDLEPLSVNPHYQFVREFYADNNKVKSINVLEGSTFIDIFNVLSLRNNDLKTIPKYILANAFDRVRHRRLHLGLNRIKCGCSTAQGLKVWLMANKIHIPDYDELLCTNVPEKVSELDQNKMCVSPRDWKDYIYYIIGAEVALFLLLISKVSYDYWVFKTAGYLPWPASKMPKMPCDWVFES